MVTTQRIINVNSLFFCTFSVAMRGLINMGNTCFLNVVIQALTHTPVLRDYLLADLHRCSSPTRSRNCLACEMVRITQEVYICIFTRIIHCLNKYLVWLFETLDKKHCLTYFFCITSILRPVIFFKESKLNVTV